LISLTTGASSIAAVNAAGILAVSPGGMPSLSSIRH